MRIKINHVLFFIDSLTFLLVLIVALFPSNFLRIILGLPFVLFFPGFILLSALFPRKGNFTDIERFALDFGLSLAIKLYSMGYHSEFCSLFSIRFCVCVFINSVVQAKEVAGCREVSITSPNYLVGQA
jgi:uncharacterized membrane protein